MKIKNVKVYGLEESIIRSGYPMQTGEPATFEENTVRTSDDWNRVQKLVKTPISSGHNNFLKGIIVQFDLQYPEYFSPQLQRYHWVDIVSSQSKMHRIASRKLTSEDFTENTLNSSIDLMNQLITSYCAIEDLAFRKATFNQIISNLPSGYLKWMGISTNYLQLKNIYHQRKSHKLKEWREFCNWIKTLPLANELILIE